MITTQLTELLGLSYPIVCIETGLSTNGIAVSWSCEATSTKSLERTARR